MYRSTHPDFSNDTRPVVSQYVVYKLLIVLFVKLEPTRWTGCLPTTRDGFDLYIVLNDPHEIRFELSSS